jgi:hypothetical protein
MENNHRWFLIFDNVDRDSKVTESEPTAYSIEDYIPGADHGSILVTTRLAKLEQLGTALKLKAVDETQARAMMTSSLGRTLEGTSGISGATR